MPTAWASPRLKAKFAPSDSLPLVWPDLLGSVRGIGLEPLHPAVPDVARRDPELGERLALVDALRLGDARLDAMPVDARILGFENIWQSQAVSEAAAVDLPSGAAIRCASPPYLFATKLEAFRGRGKGDLFGSKDFQDVAALLDGRATLVEEIVARAALVVEPRLRELGTMDEA